MKEIIVASNNQKKIKEIKEILLKYDIKVLSLKDVNIDIDIEENGSTFIENAMIKAQAIYDITLMPVIADDSGLQVEALNNEPGIYSARYAGEQKNDEDNMNKLLDNLKNVTNRKARFVAAIAFVINDKLKYTVEGYLDGEIIDNKIGDYGFGYDPIFYIPSLKKTSAQLLPEEKNKISHRAKALEKIELIIKENI
ncbi:XTP/dITP diphosphatase [Mycoplasma sp. P36-A1]|uniref:XTP/dITP diphosphatase n=1 Tax=Mycoplasma sp. P36-A1 TaxID=3252900 RepID=UPI003C2DF3A0